MPQSWVDIKPGKICFESGAMCVFAYARAPIFMRMQRGYSKVKGTAKCDARAGLLYD